MRQKSAISICHDGHQSNGNILSLSKIMEFVVTSDGSKTLYHPGVGEHYHSRHGAVQESRHVFLGMGLQYAAATRGTGLSVLEIGFGTGLNFLVSADYCAANHIHLDYTGVEAFPLPLDTLAQTGYGAYVAPDVWSGFLAAYAPSFHSRRAVTPTCHLQIAHCAVREFGSDRQYDVVYFDAFAAVHQPEMWDEATLSHVCRFLNPGGVFVTYAITGQLKRTMKALGFTVEKVPGAPGKREMLRALKTP